MARPLLANPDLLALYRRGVEVPPRPCNHCNRCSVATAILFGIAPALSAARTDLHENLKEGGKSGSGPLRRWLPGARRVGAVALSAGLAAGGGPVHRELSRFPRCWSGFRADPA